MQEMRVIATLPGAKDDFVYWQSLE